MPNKYDDAYKSRLSQIIPPLLFRKIYESNLSQFDMAVLSSSLREHAAWDELRRTMIEYHDSREILSRESRVDRQMFLAKFWVSTVIVNPQESASSLVAIARKIGLTNAKILLFATMLGHVDILRELIHHATYVACQEMIRADAYDVLRYCIPNNTKQTAKKIVDLLLPYIAKPHLFEGTIKEPDMSERPESGHGTRSALVELLGQACSSGYLNVICAISAHMYKGLGLTTNKPFIQLIQAKDYYSCRIAARKGHVNVFHWLRVCLSTNATQIEIDAMLIAERSDVLYQAVHGNQDEVAKHVLSITAPSLLRRQLAHHLSDVNFIDKTINLLNAEQMRVFLTIDEYKLFVDAPIMNRAVVLKQLIVESNPLSLRPGEMRHAADAIVQSSASSAVSRSRGTIFASSSHAQGDEDIEGVSASRYHPQDIRYSRQDIRSVTFFPPASAAAASFVPVKQETIQP